MSSVTKGYKFVTSLTSSCTSTRLDSTQRNTTPVQGTKGNLLAYTARFAVVVHHAVISIDGHDNFRSFVLSFPSPLCRHLISTKHSSNNNTTPGGGKLDSPLFHKMIAWFFALERRRTLYCGRTLVEEWVTKGRFTLWPNFERRSISTNENAEMPKVRPLGLHTRDRSLKDVVSKRA